MEQQLIIIKEIREVTLELQIHMQLEEEEADLQMLQVTRLEGLVVEDFVPMAELVIRVVIIQ